MGRNFKADIPSEERFWTYVDKTSTVIRPNVDTPCWIWIAAVGGTGNFKYGKFRFRGKNTSSHRVSFMLENNLSELSSAICILHKCDYPLCVRPTHLFAGTKQDNALDMISKNRASIYFARKIGPEGTAWCISCQNFLSIVLFSKSSAHWNGLNKRCKSCDKIRRKKS